MADNDKLDSAMDRRRYLAALSTGAAFGIAGCSGDGGSDGGSDGSDGGGDGGSDGSDGSGGGGQWGETLEVLHGWAGGDGEAAITALIEEFESEYPDMDTQFQAVGASANVNLNATILRRMVNNNPMSSFANWPGNNLERYRGHLMDLESSVWDPEGYKDVMQDRAVELCTFNGKMSSVPLGSHRMNNLFYNISAFEEAGVDASSLDDIDSLLSALDAIKTETDVTPMGQAMVAPWTVLQLWAQVLQGQAGVDAYMNFIEGNGDRQAIVESLNVVKEIQQNYITDDASSVSFTDVGGKMINGEVACMHQGNWLAGQFRVDDSFNYKEHWDWIPFPGTEGTYGYHIDAIVAPANNPSEDETIAWQKFVGTKKAQIAFNNLKGSVPLRTDIDPGELGDFIGLTYEDLTSSERYPPTIAHGLAVPPEQMGACKTAMSENMMGPYDVQSAADGLLDAVSQ
ncbi:sugar ABC transporter substrate-binding protein [Haloarcula pellucida]|uniref:Sugar ABC transporter substrate-binding protein n=2 Tax=Haloarcula pellucida TaxID=1427151 RepID=A0A830GL52_9EURY|nr:ABC transporter substrate-binding protein [Halomicroarcula pellucida]GGN91251.1 sugar ABC transporter substrate-binding protein [Halomicroarcula pellucida]